MNTKLGIIGGTNMGKTSLLEGATMKNIKTPYGQARVATAGAYAFIFRHAHDTPPHMINHKANIWALSRLTDAIVGVGSVGGLKRSMAPPRIVVPDDFMQLSQPPTFFDDEIVHALPAFDDSLRHRIIKSGKACGIRVQKGGVYFQTSGPRLETKAEVRFIAKHADIVGMTLSSEATLACELGMKYAALCSIDNLANGLTKDKLDFMKLRGAALKNSSRIEAILLHMIGDANGKDPD
jgi:5'-methylthioadenosine phosphorylase